jgi:hypothetical protein
MATNLTTPPSFSATVDQNFFIERLGGSQHPITYLDRFPDEVYNKAIDSHLVRFLYALLGPAGIGWLRKNYLDARLELLQHGFENFDLERYYGDPFRFGRILSERFEDDPTGLLDRETWDTIKAQDEAYRSRALDYFNAVRAGTTPLGMELAAKSGLGHPVEIIENYKYLFDINSDEPKGLEYIGSTLSLNEFIVLPRLEVSQSEQQTISVDGSPTGGTFVLSFQGQITPPITWSTAISVNDVQAALEGLSSIGAGNVQVSGGPGLTGSTFFVQPFLITFTGKLAGQNVPQIKVEANYLSGGVDPTITVETVTGGISAVDEAVEIAPELRHNLQVALDYLRPVNSLPTVAASPGLRTVQPFSSVDSSSNYTEVVRYATGSTAVRWPSVDATHWIEAGLEKAAPRVHDDRQHHYTGFHNVQTTYAYTGEALDDPQYKDVATVANYNSTHIGSFNRTDELIFSFLQNWRDPTLVYTPDRVLADYAEPLTVTTQADAHDAVFVNGIYPTDYISLPGIPTIKYKDEQFWASRERIAGAEVIEVDLGVAQAINFITFEVLARPLDIEIAYDVLDLGTTRNFDPVTPLTQQPFTTATHFSPTDQTTWLPLEYHFADAVGNTPFSRFVRIKFTRRLGEMGIDDYPTSVLVRNLRVGRNSVT